MFRPLRTDEDRKARAYYMLAAGGRVVRSHHHPGASSNRLMVPTERELKTILYDQTGARVMAHSRRENIDYVALNAGRRRPRRAIGEGINPKGHQVAVGRATTQSPCRERASTNLCRRLTSNPSEGGDVRHRLIGADDSSPQRKEESGDLHPCPSPEHDAPVSVFLQSFSAFGMATEGPVQAADVMRDSQPTWQDQAPDRVRVAHKAEAAANNTEAAYELSEPLAQVNVYSILANVTPAEIGSVPHGPSGAEVCGDPKLPKKSGKNKRAWGSIHRADHSGSGEQRLIKAEQAPKVAYLDRDPLGDEVAEMDAKLQKNARRLKQERAKQQPPRAIDIARRSALLAEKKKLQSSNTESAAYSNASENPTVPTTKHDCGTTTTGGLDRCGDGGAVRLDRRRNRRGFVSTTDAALPHRAGRRGRMGSSDEGSSKRQTYCGKPTELTVEINGEMVDLEDASRTTVDCGLEARIGFGHPTSLERGVGKVVDRKPPRRRKGSEPKDRGEVHLKEGENPAKSGGSTESGDEPLAARTSGDNNGAGNKEHVSQSEGSGIGTAGDGRGVSCSTGDVVRVLTENAAALRIEACWRGFVGKCAAKHELRSVLLGALRNIGGGKVSKAMALGDVAEEDRRELKHALRTATQSRLPLRQLPSQVHILECTRFVAAFQRRHAKAVDAKKKRWVAEREKRKETQRRRARCGVLKPVSTAKSHLLRFVQA